MMDDKDLIEYSIDVKRNARKLLHESKLNTLLKKHGRTFLHGSFELDLMYDYNVDYAIECAEPAKTAKAVLEGVIKGGYFKNSKLVDFMKNPNKDGLNGFSLILNHDFLGQKWEIEIWFLQSIKDKEMFTHKSKLKLNPDTRLAILKKKYERSKSGKNKDDVSSYQICCDVLEL